MKAKVFIENSEQELEGALNKWLAEKENLIEVLYMTQSESVASGGRWSATLTLLYRYVKI